MKYNQTTGAERSHCGCSSQLVNNLLQHFAQTQFQMPILNNSHKISPLFSIFTKQSLQVALHCRYKNIFHQTVGTLGKTTVKCAF